jgi:hypothetical protein
MGNAVYRLSDSDFAGSDLVAEWSTIDNPNGLWSLGCKDSKTGSFVLYDKKLNTSSGVFWYVTNNSSLHDYSPSAWRNDSAQQSVGINPGECCIHPGQAGEWCVVRWTAPQSMTVHVTGFFGAGNSGVGTYTILQNNTTQLFNVAGPSTQNFDQTISVTLGDTLDFQFGDVYFCGSTPISVNISYQTTNTVRVRNVRHHTFDASIFEVSPDSREIIQNYILQGSDSTLKNISNWVSTTDGRYMTCWVDSSTYQLQTGYSVDTDFLTANYAIESVSSAPDIVATSAYTRQTSLYRRSDGKVLLFLQNMTAGNYWLRCYISDSGNGNDWALYSTIQSVTAGSLEGNNIHGLNIPVVTVTGRLILAFGGAFNYFGYTYRRGFVFVSDDDGATWVEKWNSPASPSYAGQVGQPVVLPNGIIYFGDVNAGGNTMRKSVDNGTTWTVSVDFSSGFSSANRSVVLGISCYYDPLVEQTYLVATENLDGAGIYVLSDYTKFEDKTAWTYLAGFYNGGIAYIFPVGTNMVILSTANDKLYGSIYTAAVTQVVGYVWQRDHQMETCKIHTHQQWDGYPQSPSLTETYPYQLIIDAAQDRLRLCTGKVYCYKPDFETTVLMTQGICWSYELNETPQWTAAIYIEGPFGSLWSGAGTTVEQLLSSVLRNNCDIYGEPECINVIRAADTESSITAPFWTRVNL